MKNSLDKIFKPGSIAVIGASGRAGSVGFAVMKNLVEGGFGGPIYPVNKRAQIICGLKTITKVGKIREPVDLAIVATPAVTVPGVVVECGKKGITGMIILSAGFKEAGAEGMRAFDEIEELARKYHIRIVGPNCLGVIHPEHKLNASFASHMSPPGKLAFISQSGALGTAILDWAVDQNVGFNYFVSIGSMVDVGFHDLIDYLGNDPDTASILIYMETLTDARKFMSAARAVSRSKPIIVLKAGKSEEGAKAALSHTGSLTGNDAAFDTAFLRSGIIRVETIGQLFHCAQTLAMQNRPAGNRLAIVTNAGGPAILATDYLMENGGETAQLSEKTFKRLNELMPAVWSHRNPVDVLGDATVERYRQAVELALADENVDGVLSIFVPVATTDASEVARALTHLDAHPEKPLLASWLGERDVKEARKILYEGHIPTYRFPESAVDTFLRMYLYNRNLKLLYETPADAPGDYNADTQKARGLLERIMAEGRTTFTEYEAKSLLSCYEIPVAPGGLAANADEAARIGAEIGFPVAMKISSPDVMHKSDYGGVQLNIQNGESARIAFHSIRDSIKAAFPAARIQGVLVEKMERKRLELIIGAKKDPVFGPIILFGLGGISVELFKDSSIGLPPLNMAQAKRIIENTKVYKLMKGFRGMPGVDIESVQYLLCKFANLLVDFPEIKELDINPFGVDEKGGVVLDAKVVVDPEMSVHKIKPYSHLVISPYPKKYIREVMLKNGRTALLRPIRPEDEPMEAEMFSHFSKETQHFRFFGYVPHPTHDVLTRFTQIDYDREMAIIVEMEEEEKKIMAGVVRIVSGIHAEEAEFAIVVADPWHGLGLGNLLTDYILEIARERGLKKIYANVLKANKAMLHIFKKRGFTLKSEDYATYFAELKLGNAD